MKQFIILRSVTNNARSYAKTHFKYCSWFDSVIDAIEALEKGERPHVIVADGRNMSSISMGPKVMSWGYAVQIKGVP